MSSPYKSGPYSSHTFKVLKNLAPSLINPVFKKRGFQDARLVQEWPSIIGSQWASHSSPEKLVCSRSEGTGGTLHIRTSSGGAFLLRHIEPQIIERINCYFGRPVVARLKFIHDSQIADPPSISSTLPGARQSSDEATEQMPESLKGLPEPLREALFQLGKTLAGHHR